MQQCIFSIRMKSVECVWADMATNLIRKIEFAIVVACMPSVSFSGGLPSIIFTERGIYLSTNPEEHANLGERLSLTDLGRRFPSCRVTSEYYQGDDEGIATTITCVDVSVSVNRYDTGAIYSFWTAANGATSTEKAQVGDPVTEAVGSTAYCNLCTEDAMPFCKSGPKSRFWYDIEYSSEHCVPVNIENRESCRGTHRVKPCARIVGLGVHEAP